MDSIATKFPDLALKSRNAKARFHRSALGVGHRGVVEKYDILTGGNLDEYMAPIKERLRQSVEKANFPRSYALQKINQATELKVTTPEDFAVTISAEDVLSTLLSWNETYQKKPVKEVLDGWTRVFSTRDEPKAKGLDFAMEFPMSWKPKTSNSPNIVQEFYSQCGHGYVSCNIIVRNGGETPSLSELKHLFSVEMIREMASQLGTVLDAKEITMAQLPAGFYIIDITQRVIDIEMSMRMTRYVLMIEDKMVMIDFMETSAEGEPVYTEEDRQENQELFKMIAASFNNIGPFRN